MSECQKCTNRQTGDCPYLEDVIRNGEQDECSYYKPQTRLHEEKAMSEIKPCPFCGWRADTYDNGWENLQSDFVVYCMNCGSEGKHCTTTEEAIEAWNRRV